MSISYYRCNSMTIQAYQMNIRILAIPTLCVLLLLTSCIMIPIPTPESKILAGKPVTDEQLDFLNLNPTKQEVMERLGNPSFIWEDKRIFTYNWDMRQGILIWAVGAMTASGGAAGGGGVEDIPKHYLLLIQFDEQEQVMRWERATRPLYQTYIDFLQDWALP